MSMETACPTMNLSLIHILWQKLEQENSRPAIEEGENYSFAPVDTMIRDNLWICPITPKYQNLSLIHISMASTFIPGCSHASRSLPKQKKRTHWYSKPGIKVDAIGEMNLSSHNGKINLSCKVEELTQYVADSSNYNQ